MAFETFFLFWFFSMGPPSSEDHWHSNMQRWYLICQPMPHAKWEHQSNVPIQGLSTCASHGPSQSHFPIFTHRHWSRLHHGKKYGFWLSSSNPELSIGLKGKMSW
jgi:hypothetical protein